MGGWRPLPGDLPPDLRRLVEQLRLLKDRTGLSLVALSERTACSKSAWQRYLNGTKLPPRSAVEALGRVAGADAPRLLALWALAERDWIARESESAELTGCQAKQGAPGPARAPAARVPAVWAPSVRDPSVQPSVPPSVPPSSVWAAGPGWGTAKGVVSVAAVVAAAVGAGAWLAVEGLGAVPAGQAARADGLRAAVVASPPARGQGGGGAGTASVDRQLRGAPGPIAPVCSGPACQGLNPRTTGCDRGAHTIGSVAVDGLSLELRFSPRCRAAWAQAEGGPGARLREVAVASEDGRLLAEPLGPRAAPGRAAPSAGLSPMLSAADPAAVEACALVDDVEACAGAADHGGAPGRFGYLPPG